MLSTFLSRRPHKQAVVARVKALGRTLAKAHRRYQGGLAAERQSLESLRVETARQMRAELFGRKGRRIELVQLLGQRRADGQPVWALADPDAQIDALNGAWDWPAAGQPAEAIIYASRWGRVIRIQAGQGGPGLPTLIPSGVPALPKRVRKLLRSTRLRRYAAWVGVLYQPEEWRRANPDPAVVVEWLDRPGEYYALAVWGVDRPWIMEFVA